MSSTKSDSPQTAASRLLGIGLALTTLLVGGAALWWRSATPQLAEDEAVLAALDGLFTAVTARRTDMLANCEAQLRLLDSQGKIPEPAARHVFQIVAQAQAGQWEASARKLYTFIQRQRRPTAGG